MSDVIEVETKVEITVRGKVRITEDKAYGADYDGNRGQSVLFSDVEWVDEENIFKDNRGAIEEALDEAAVNQFENS